MTLMLTIVSLYLALIAFAMGFIVWDVGRYLNNPERNGEL